MSTLNVRLPEELDRWLAREAELSHKPRSELAREAIRAYLEGLEQQRYLARFLQEARAVYGDERLGRDARALDNELGDAEADPPAEPNRSPDDDWWR